MCGVRIMSLTFTAGASGNIYGIHNGNVYGIYNGIVYPICIAIALIYNAIGTCCECETPIYSFNCISHIQL